MVSSIAENGGRSCVNASGVWTTAHAREIAEALAERLAAVAPARRGRSRGASSRPSPTRRSRERISAMIDRELEAPGAVDVTARHRAGGRRRATWSGATYLLPTVVLCDSPEHPLANREFLFPFASVVPVRPRRSRRASAPRSPPPRITADPALLDRMLASPLAAPAEPRRRCPPGR